MKYFLFLIPSLLVAQPVLELKKLQDGTNPQPKAQAIAEVPLSEPLRIKYNISGTMKDRYIYVSPVALPGTIGMPPIIVVFGLTSQSGETVIIEAVETGGVEGWDFSSTAVTFDSTAYTFDSKSEGYRVIGDPVIFTKP